MRLTATRMRQQGTSLVEVLVAMIILAIGLLGLVGLQARLQVLQMESYQRAQALMLLHDMASRIALNRNNAASYVTTAGSPTGTGTTCGTTATTRQQADVNEWCAAIQGSAETTNAGATKLGAMVGGRGCVESLPGDEYMVTVAWQGLAPISAPPNSVACGKNLYNSTATGAQCINDLCRRVVTTIVRIATLT